MINTKKERPFSGKDLKGLKFSRLTVVGSHGFYRPPKLPHMRDAIWNCICECGNRVNVTSARLKSGNTRSCGCLHAEVFRKITTRHGHKTKNKIHPLYYMWQGMIQRCSNPKHYGAKWYLERGIKVCSRWKSSFQNFLDDMGERPANTSIDRINNSGDYTPSNCCWSTIEKQHKNKRQRGKKCL